MKETVESRAVTIAAKIMTAAGLCVLDEPAECRRLRADETTCDECIRLWLMAKARKEMKGAK